MIRRTNVLLSLLLAVAGCADATIEGDASELDAVQGAGGVAGSGGAEASGGEGIGGAGAASACQLDCSSIATPQCQVAQCDESSGQCEVVPAPSGAPCDDELYCTVDETCDAGVCGGGVTNDCGMAPAQCVSVSCDEATKSCSSQPADDGASCSTGDKCTVNTACKNGLCVGAPKDCFFAPVPDACHVGVCNPATGVCDPMPGNDGKPCPNDGDLCMVQKVCAGGSCEGGVPKDCSSLSNNCNLGVCDPVDGQCMAEPIPPGGACNDAADECNVGVCNDTGVCQPVPTPGVACPSATDTCNNGFCNAAGTCEPTPTNGGATCSDGNSCTTGETCQAGVCTGGVVGNYVAYFTETFASNAAGWTLGPEWQIGPTAVSVGQVYGNPDPGNDHTASSDNGVAGVQLGGNASTTLHPPQYLTSPVIDVSAAPGQVYVELWRWLNSDYTPYMKNTVDVYNGSQWVNLWTTGGSPGVQDNMWTKVSFDLTPYKNAQMQLRFGFEIGSTGVFSVAGWNIDDFVIANQVCN
jgi:hypothetical protein